MRIASLLVGFAAAALAQSAWAAPVTVAPVAVSAEFQTELDDELGAREGDVLRNAVTRSVTAALTRHGATVAANAPVTIETTIIEADPNRPTFEQVSHRPGLDLYRSMSVGGAELRAVVRAADGRVLSEVTHRRYNPSFVDLTGGESTWSEARYAIRQFAEKVADAYAASAQ